MLRVGNEKKKDVGEDRDLNKWIKYRGICNFLDAAGKYLNTQAYCTKTDVNSMRYKIIDTNLKYFLFVNKQTMSLSQTYNIDLD